MSEEIVRGIVLIATAGIMVCGPLLVIIWVWFRKRQPGDPISIGLPAIWTILIVIAVPAIVILSMYGKLDGGVVGTLFGALFGYVLKDAVSPKSGDK